MEPGLLFDVAAGLPRLALAGDRDRRDAEFGEVGLDLGVAVAAVGGHRGGDQPEPLGDPFDRGHEQRPVGRVADMHAAVEHDPVDVVGDLGLIAVIPISA